MAEQHSPSLRILRRKQLEEKLGLGKSAIYARLDPKSPHFDPAFPKPIDLGGGKNPPIGWIEAEADAWLSSRIELSRKAA